MSDRSASALRKFRTALEAEHYAEQLRQQPMRFVGTNPVDKAPERSLCSPDGQATSPGLLIDALERRCSDLLWAVDHIDDSDLRLKLEAAAIVASAYAWEQAWHDWRRAPETYPRPA